MLMIADTMGLPLWLQLDEFSFLPPCAELDAFPEILDK